MEYYEKAIIIIINNNNNNNKFLSFVPIVWILRTEASQKSQKFFFEKLF